MLEDNFQISIGEWMFVNKVIPFTEWYRYLLYIFFEKRYDSARLFNLNCAYSSPLLLEKYDSVSKFNYTKQIKFKLLFRAG